MKGSTKAMIELVIPILLVITNKGTTRIGNGIIVEESSIVNNRPLPLNRNFAKAYPARLVIIKAKTVVSKATTKLLRIQREKGQLENSLA